MQDFIGVIRLISQHWYSFWGLLFLQLAIASVAFFLAAQFDLSNMESFLLWVSLSLIAFYIWYVSLQPPKPEKGKLGFAVSLWSSNSDLHQKVHDDFLVELQKLIRSSKASRFIDFIEVPQHIARTTIDHPSADKLRQSANYHFLCFGRSREDLDQDGRGSIVIDLEAILVPPPLTDARREKLSKEVIELFPRRAKVDSNQCLVPLEVTSRLFSAVCKYILGLALGMSGALSEAEDLLLESITDCKRVVNEKSVKVSSNTPKEILDRAPDVLEEVLMARASYYFSAWRDDRESIESLVATKEQLAKIDPNCERLDYLTLFAIVSFVLDDDCRAAEAALLKFPKSNRDAIWNLNVAFLYAFEGNMTGAAACYRKASKMGLAKDKFWEIEDFLDWMVKRYPEKIQLHYCLGIFNKYLKGDEAQAAQDFEKFLDISENGSFDKEQALARRWIQETTS